MVGRMPTVASRQPSASAPARQVSQVAASSSWMREKTWPPRADGLPFSSTLNAASSGTTSGLSMASSSSLLCGCGCPSASTIHASSSKPTMSPRWLSPSPWNSSPTSAVSAFSRRRNRLKSSASKCRLRISSPIGAMRYEKRCKRQARIRPPCALCRERTSVWRTGRGQVGSRPSLTGAPLLNRVLGAG